MKNAMITLALLLGLGTSSCFAGEKEDLVGKAMPLLPTQTLDGKTIDNRYYSGHVSVVSFMYVACLPCMKEIGTLNSITDEYAANSNVQVLCVARQTNAQMEEFNSDGKGMLSRVRRAFDADTIKYAIQPACTGIVSNMVRTKTNDTDEVVTLKSECNTIEETFHFNSFPHIFLVDKKGIVRKIIKGGPGTKNDQVFYKELREEIEKLLAE